MFDVLPPHITPQGGVARGTSDDSDRRRARPVRPAVTSNKGKDRLVHAGPRVVQMNWKLPARLRKPIRHQLANERAKRKKRMHVVRFERRPIETRPVFSNDERQIASQVEQRGLKLPKHRIFNRGAEHHTGDVYRTTTPQLHMTAPPYVGSAMSEPTGMRSRDLGIRSDARHVEKSPRKIRRVKGRPMEGVRIQPKVHVSHRTDGVRSQATPFYNERDIPLNFDEAQREYEPSNDLFVNVEEPVSHSKRFFAIPFRFSFLPWSRFRDHKKKVFSARDARVKFNLIALSGVSFAALFLVWNLQGVGRGLSVLNSVQDRSQSALGELLAAQSALAGNDFVSGEDSFVAADEMLGAARKELDEALSASQYILRVIDLTGTVRSGQDLLETGELLAETGQHITRALGPLLESTEELSFVEGSVAGIESQNLVDAIREGQVEVAAAADKLAQVEKKLDTIDSPFLPVAIQDQLAVLQGSVPRAKSILETISNQSDTYLYLLGENHDREYLVLFANNDELRPVGGFIGTIGLVNIDRGQVESVDIGSVYDGDGQLKELIAPPSPLLSIVPRWYQRDANWFVDYEISAQKVASFFEKQGGSTVDGVIMMTPDVIERLLAITGPIEVPGHETAVTVENFAEVTQAAVTYDYDKELNRPKQFLSDLTPILLNRVFDADGAEGKLAVLSAIAQSISEKDMMLYFHNEEAQQQLSEAHWAGNLPINTQGFLAVNNANIGGHKSDQFVEQEIDYRTVIEGDGDVEVTVTVRREHRGPSEKIDYDYPEGENPAFKDNIIYQRVLVPKGAELIEAQGFTPTSEVPRAIIPESDLPLVADRDLAQWESGQQLGRDGTTIGSESGYTFFANWIVTKPGNTTVALYRYRIPGHAKLPTLIDPVQSYSMHVFKQPGDARTTVRSSLELPSYMRMIHTVPDSGITRETDHSLIYRGDLNTDKVIGAVFEKST